LNLHESRFTEHESGLLGEENWNAWVHVVGGDMSIPEFQEVWQTARAIYPTAFVAFVDEQIVAASAMHVGRSLAKQHKIIVT
jgi:hypothetical protein